MTAPAQDEQLSPFIPAVPALALLYARAMARIRESLAQFITRQFRHSGRWRDADADAFVRAVVPMVAGAQQAVSAVTVGYLNEVASELTGAPRPPSGVLASEVTGSAVRGGVDPVVVYRRPYTQVWTDLAAGTPLEIAIDAGERRALTIANTDLQLTKTQTAKQVFAKDERVVGYRRVPQGPHTCALCLIVSTRRYHKEQLAGVHPNCVVGDTWVSARGVEAATRRRYTGELTIITTASGNQVTVTPNHPILTDQGWVPAHLIRQGDHVVRSTEGQRTGLGGPHKGQCPARAEDVWRAVSVAGFVRVPLAAEDFHGDGTDSEVEIVRTDGYFPPIGDIPFGQQGYEALLMNGRWAGKPFIGGSPLDSLATARLAPSDSVMCGGDLRGPLVGRHMGSAQGASFLTSSTWNPMVHQESANGGTFNAVPFSQGQLRLAVDVTLDNLSEGETAPGAPARRFDPPRVEFVGEGRRTYARLGRSLLDRLAGQVDFDSVVDVRRVTATTHVYNLRTTGGWFSANGLIVSNCDCDVEPIYGMFDPGPVLDEDFLNAIHDAIARDLGEDYVAASGKLTSTVARELNYRDIVITHQHGEIGPVLGVRGQHFTGPDKIRRLTHSTIE